MADDKATGLKAITQQQEAIFIRRVIGVSDQAGLLVQKNGRRLLK